MVSLRRALIALAVAASMACGGASTPTAPTASLPPAPVAVPAPPPPQPPVTFPPTTGPSRVFVFDRPLDYAVREFTKQSRFVLYDNGAFTLEYLSPGFVLPGQYARDSDGTLKFLFQAQGRSIDEPWDDAVGTLDGDTLTIEFELRMQHSDYENAVYVLAR